MENNPDKSYPFFRFEDLRVYHKALDYIAWVNKVTINNADKNYELVRRINYSAQNIALNIAEGSARSKTQFIYHLKIAKSAVRECLVFTSTLLNVGLIDEEANVTSRNHLMEMTKMIGALISSLQRTMTKEDEEDDYTEKFEKNSYKT